MVERSAARLILAVEAPGTYYFRAGAQDPRAWLPDYKLTASFHGAYAFRLATKEEPVAIDPDPNSPPEEPVAIDPDPNSPPEEPVAIDPDPNSIAVGSAVERPLANLCLAARSDDHSDVSTCASPVVTGGNAAGRLDNDWGDDDDFFTFTLTELESVAIGTSGTTDTFGALFDAAGRRLATDDDGGDGSNFLIVRTLVPGRYFVRVEGSLNAEGPYELGVSAVGW